MVAQFKSKAWIASGVFLLAFVLRLIFAETWSSWPYGLVPYLDAKSYDLWAKQIAEGHLLRHQAFYQSPLYPYFLALIYKIVGTNGFYVSIIQAALDACTCALMALTAFEISGWAAGVSAGILAALYRPMVFFAAPIMKETLSLFVLAMGLYIFLRALRFNRWYLWLSSGLFIGLAIIARSNLGIVALAMAAASCWPLKIKKLKNGALFSIAVAMPILTTLTHNWWVSEDFVPVTYSGGFNFNIGYHPGASGYNIYPEGVSTDPLKEEQDVRRFAEQATGRKLSPSEVSSYWTDETWKWIHANPLISVKLFFEKMLIGLSNFEPPDNYDQNFVLSYFSSILNWIPITFGILLALFSSAFLLVRRKLFEVRVLTSFTLAYLVSISLFYVTDRYRLPIVIFMFPVIGAGFGEVFSKKKWRIKDFSVQLGVLAAVGLCSYLARPGEEIFRMGNNHGILTTLYFELGRYKEAVEAMYPALYSGASGVMPNAFIATAESLERLGKFEDANRNFQEAVNRFPRDGMTLHSYGVFKLNRGELKPAQELFQKAIEVSPWFFEPYVGLAVAAVRMGDKKTALAAVEKGEALNPTFPEFKKLRAVIFAK